MAGPQKLIGQFFYSLDCVIFYCMDVLQIALVLLVILLGFFLSVTGVQVFFILRDLKKALDNFTGVSIPVKKVNQVSSPKISIPAKRLFKRKS